MTPQAYLLSFALAGWVVVLVFLLYTLKHYRCKWRGVRVCPLRRGPNADTHYHCTTHQGREVWFTDEQVLAAKVRASSLAAHPYTYE